MFDQTRNVARNYFFDTAADEAQHLVPNARGDLVIVTTMDTAMTDEARRAISSVLDKQGLYFGFWSSATTSFAQRAVYESGLTRSSSFAAAARTLP